MVVLLDRQIAYLDHLAADIRLQTGAVVKRTEIIRALVDAAQQSDIDFSQVTSEADLREMIVRRLSR